MPVVPDWSGCFKVFVDMILTLQSEALRRATYHDMMQCLHSIHRILLHNAKDRIFKGTSVLNNHSSQFTIRTVRDKVRNSPRLCYVQYDTFRLASTVVLAQSRNETAWPPLFIMKQRSSSLLPVGLGWLRDHAKSAPHLGPLDVEVDSSHIPFPPVLASQPSSVVS